MNTLWANVVILAEIIAGGLFVLSAYNKWQNSISDTTIKSQKEAIICYEALVSAKDATIADLVQKVKIMKSEQEEMQKDMTNLHQFNFTLQQKIAMLEEHVGMGGSK